MIMLVSGFINGLRKVMNGTDTEWQQRTELLLGEDKMLRLRNSHVLVVGLGGVGAYAAEMICRAGVGQMTIVDAATCRLCIPHWDGRRRKYWQSVSKISIPI